MCLNHTQITTMNMRGKFFTEHYIVSLQIRGMITWAGVGYPYPIPLNSLGVGLNSHPITHLPQRPSPRMSCTHGRAPSLRLLTGFGIGVGVHIPTAREVVASGSAVVTRCCHSKDMPTMTMCWTYELGFISTLHVMTSRMLMGTFVHAA
jgi:hypothetical protein